MGIPRFVKTKVFGMTCRQRQRQGREIFDEPKDCSEVNNRTFPLGRKWFTNQLIRSILQASLPDSLFPVSQLSLFICHQKPKATLQSPFLIVIARSRASLISKPASVLIDPSMGDSVGD